ncbi:MAG TPA: YicC/YloC family endoribonuclease [Rhabdochlamydiaceae bacterium]|jgi:uncharacterized protein (TIGR00255 family)
MSKSMTAYGRASDSFPFGKLIVEIHSVNRKILDMLIYLPKDHLRFDMDVRKWIASEIERGQITVRVNLLSEEVSPEITQGYLSQLKYLQKTWNHIAEELSFDPKESVSLSFLLNQLQEKSPLDTKHQEQEIKNALQRIVHAALDELVQMKRTEGKALSADVHKRLQLIEEQIQAIEDKKEEPYERYKQKIIERLREIGEVPEELEEKITRELVFLAERLDITEELVRLRAHIEQFRHHLLSSEKAVGRTLEFIVQEMLREINTLGSKATDANISTFVVAIKSELEKIREQIQNIE